MRLVEAYTPGEKILKDNLEYRTRWESRRKEVVKDKYIH